MTVLNQYILLNGVEATGTGSGVLIPRITDHGMQVNFSNSGGSVTALAVDLEGSIDGTNFGQIGRLTFTAGERTAEFAIKDFNGYTVNYVRANIITLTETGTTAVTVLYTPGMKEVN